MSTKTHWKKLHNPDYFGAWSIPEGEDLILTIKDIQMEEVTAHGGKKENLPVLHFKEKQKPLILNVTNSRQIERLYGSPYIEDWNGKQIQVYQDTTKFAGEEVECVRIRPMVPNTKKPPFTPESNRWPGAVEKIAEGESTIQAIKKHFTLSEKHEAQLKEEINTYLESKEAEVADA